ncbi:MAG: sugar phosphate isomerase/epimerase [Chitinophagaceae bacterium]
MSDKMSRRKWSTLSLAGLAGIFVPSGLISCRSAASAAQASQGATTTGKSGVIIGAQTYSFRDMDLAAALKAMNDIGIKSCELWQGHVEPREFMWKAGATPQEVKQKAEKIKNWRSTVKMDEITAIRDQINKAGITIQAYNGPFSVKDTDEEMELVFRTAQALGTDTITTSATVPVMKRVDALAQKYKIKVAMHNHSHVEDPNQFASPESFLRGMEGNSNLIRINLDIGHFTAANFDAVDFMKKNHDKIVCIHIKDRKKNQGPNVPLGEGDTPIAAVLTLIRDNKWPIPANIEYEYKGADTVAEVKKCFDYCTRILNA